MTYISDDMRRFVQERANFRCEYCLLHQNDSVKSHEIDHIIAEKHQGETELENLCLSCFVCNRYKGSDLSSFDLETKEVVRLFNPRNDKWDEHFKLDGSIIEPLTPFGRVTLTLLRINAPERIIERETLIRLGRFP